MSGREQNHDMVTVNKQLATTDSRHAKRIGSDQGPLSQQLALDEARSASGQDTVHRDVLKTWWAEMTCLFGVLTALLAIVSTLITHQNQAVQQWPYGFSINSLVSAYAVILKGAMLIIISTGISQLKWVWFEKDRNLSDIDDWDQASRGVLGSLTLTWRLKASHSTVTVGAIVTTLALAVDAMVQFLVRYETCNVEQQNFLAQIARSNDFQTIGYDTGDIKFLAKQLPPDFTSVIMAGLFKPEPIAASAICPTGNCTFSQPYHFLGYCGQCEDLSSQLSVHCWSYNKTTNNFKTLEKQCNYSLPNGFSNSSDSTESEQGSYFVIQPDEDSYEEPWLTYSMISNNLTSFNDGTFLKSDTEDPFLFEDCSLVASNSSWICAGAGAASCTLQPCIRTYTASIVNGKQQENTTAISRVFDQMVEPSSWFAVDVGCLPPDIRQELIDLQYPITNYIEWIRYYESPHYNASLGGMTQQVTIPEACLYEFSVVNGNDLVDYISSLLSGNVTYAFNTPYGMEGPPGPLKLFNDGNISFESVDGTFSDIGDSVTQYIRQTQGGQPGNYPTNGTIWREEICIGVRWPFLILPVILVVLTLIFFVSMVIKTSTRPTGYGWKDSATALILHGIHHGQKRRQTPLRLDTKERMTSVAKDLTVKLDHDPDQHELFFTVVEKTSPQEECPNMDQPPSSQTTDAFIIKRKPVSQASE